MMDAAQKQAEMEAAKANIGSAVAYRGDAGAMLTANPVRPSLRERVSYDLERARQSSYKRDRMEELAHLLDRNPEIARILDLVEDLRG